MAVRVACVDIMDDMEIRAGVRYRTTHFGSLRALTEASLPPRFSYQRVTKRIFESDHRSGRHSSGRNDHTAEVGRFSKQNPSGRQGTTTTSPSIQAKHTRCHAFAKAVKITTSLERHTG